jgi:hypothetical protein
MCRRFVSSTFCKSTFCFRYFIMSTYYLSTFRLCTVFSINLLWQLVIITARFLPVFRIHEILVWTGSSDPLPKKRIWILTKICRFFKIKVSFMLYWKARKLKNTYLALLKIYFVAKNIAKFCTFLRYGICRIKKIISRNTKNTKYIRRFLKALIMTKKKDLNINAEIYAVLYTAVNYCIIKWTKHFLVFRSTFIILKGLIYLVGYLVLTIWLMFTNYSCFLWWFVQLLFLNLFLQMQEKWLQF